MKFLIIPLIAITASLACVALILLAITIFDWSFAQTIQQLNDISNLHNPFTYKVLGVMLVFAALAGINVVILVVRGKI